MALKPVLLSIAAAAFIASLSSCEPNDQSSSTTQHTGITPPKRADSASASRSMSPADTALRLPVLDALFYEEGFEQELKTKLSLTDKQVDTLKAVSRESVAGLSEDGTGDYAGSTRGAAKQAEEQLRAILGEDKSRQLAGLVNQRYAGGDVTGVMPTTPNAVPTDTRIVVNAPAYRMDVFQDGQLIKTYKVGIGYPEFPLPTGMRRAENIIFNPTWTPPDEAWVKGKFKAGKKVGAGSKLNPLGPIKIPIGSPSLIHGGKQVAKLGGFASHGCVGLTNDQIQDVALTMAQLSGSPVSQEDVIAYGKKKGETKSVKLAKPVSVELRYETIVAENGGLRIFRDVYERGTNTIETARRVLQVYGVSYESLTAQEKQALEQALTAMNRDPQGNPIAESGPAVTDTVAAVGSADSGSYKGVAASKIAGAKKGKVTSTVVGSKEIAVPIAALKGKGYPVPVNLNAGGKMAATGTVTASTVGNK